MQWLRPWQQLLTRMRGRRQGRCVRSWQRRPQLDLLEDRLPPAHDTLGSALPLAFAASPVAQVSGTLTTANQVDLYAVALHQGDQLTAAINAQQQGSPLQAALLLFDGSGAELPATASSNGGDPQLTFSVSMSGTYFVGVSSSGDATYDPTTGGNRGNGHSTGLYSLSVTDLLARFVDATPLNSSGQMSGTLTGGQPQDYSVIVTSDTYLIATAVPESSPGFEPRLTLYDATSQLLIQSDQQEPGPASATLEQHLQPGTYYLEVSAAASTSAAAGHQAYQLTTALAASLPPFGPLPGDGGPTLAVADLGNGHPDIVTTDGNSVVVLLGNGDGTFQPAETFAVGNGPYSVAVADLGNGHTDIVTANQGDISYDYKTHTYVYQVGTVLLGNGDGTFQPALSFAVGTDPVAVAVADLGNGHADIVTANQQANTVSVLLGNGDGTFQPAKSIAVGNGPVSVAVADLGNGHPDIVTANGVYDPTTNSFGSTVSVLLGNGDGTFQPAQSYAVGGLSPQQVVVADVNGDGRPDIVTANKYSNDVSVLLGNGDGTFQPAKPIGVGAPLRPYSVAVADVNGDGRPDIVTANGTYDSVSVFLGNGDGTFQSAVFYPVDFFPTSCVVADLGNGHPDIIVAGGLHNLSVLLGNGDGTFQTTQPLGVGLYPDSVAVADLGNGHPDIITCNAFDSTVSVLLGNGDGTFQPAQSYATYGTFQPAQSYTAAGYSPQQVVVADVNGDGRPDIITSNNDGSVSVLLGNGDGTFQPALSFLGTGANGWGLAVADLTGNGIEDIVQTSNVPDGTVSVLLGNGDGTFQPPQSYPVGSDPVSVAVADLGNGHPDIVTGGCPTRS